MYSVFEKLCKDRKVTAYQVAKATGISSVTLTDWKYGRSKPKIDKLVKIAAFFDVPVTVFIEKEET